MSRCSLYLKGNSLAPLIPSATLILLCHIIWHIHRFWRLECWRSLFCLSQSYINLRPFAPPHLEMRVDSPAFSGKEFRRSRHPSRGGWSHSETRVEPSWVVPQPPRHLFPHPLEIRPDAPHRFKWNPNIKSEHKGPLTPHLYSPEKDSGSKSNSTRGLTTHPQLKRQAESHAST